MTEKRGERDERAAWMVYGHKGRVRDDVERLLAAIVRVGPPADIGEEAGGVPQAAFFGRLVETRGPHEPVSPGNQVLRMRGGTRPEHVELVCCGEQRILLARFLIEHG